MSARVFFLDMNAFYVSVEQQECEAYRGEPTIVVPLLTDRTCVIAASYEAKRHGIKAGTSVGLARLACPGLHIIEARPPLYLDYHARIVDILHAHFAAVRILSVDEMACPVPPFYDTPEKEAQLARTIKEQMRLHIGEYLRASIGIAPNVFLAKVASDVEKPNGLTIWTEGDLPGALFGLRLTDLPGIGSRIKARLLQHDITTVEALLSASPTALRRAWGSVVGERWFYMLRGCSVCDYEGTNREIHKSVGHSHVLPPALRSMEGAREILIQLMAKALKRLRAYRQAAGAVQVCVQYRRTKGALCDWTRRSARHLHSNDDATWRRIVCPLLASMPDLDDEIRPIYAGIVFSDLLACSDVNLSLFDGSEGGGAATDVDAPADRSRYRVPARIPFGAPDHAMAGIGRRVAK